MKTWPELNISILLTGSELVEGRLQDSNSLFIARYLFERGQKLSRVIICNDDHDDIVDSLNLLSESSDVIITSGGLGPTTGDKTRDSIAQFLNVSLKLDNESLEKIKLFFKERNRKYESNNDKQAQIPEFAKILPNAYGTAVCFSAAFPKKGDAKGIIFALPGVPRELEKLFPEQVMPGLAQHFSIDLTEANAPALYPIRVFGLGESAIGARVVESMPDPSVQTSYRATFPEVQVLFKALDSSVPRKKLEMTALNAVSKIGEDFVFSSGIDLSLVEVVHNVLIQKSLTIALAESCSGGMLGSLLTQKSGSSAYFLGSYVTYSNQLKESMLAVPAIAINSFGAVSAEVARAMAEGARKHSAASMAVSITGIAGPEGGSSEKPVGTCYLGLSDENGTLSARIFFPGSRERIRQYACYAALDLIRRRLLGLKIDLPLFIEVERRP